MGSGYDGLVELFYYMWWTRGVAEDINKNVTVLVTRGCAVLVWQMAPMSPPARATLQPRRAHPTNPNQQQRHQ